MTADEFTATAIAILRTSVGWQTKIADRLGVNRRTVVRWLAAGETPADIDNKLAELMRARDLSPWPRDEWIIGDALGGDGRRREYIIHTAAPRFIGRIVPCDDDGRPEVADEPADILSGVVFASEDYVICEIDWIDEPMPGEIAQIMEAAADEIERQS